jgi:long-chain acyl-CoA synthetase
MPLVRDEISRLNAALPRYAQIKRAFILPRPLAAGKGELTPTLKLRRFIVHQNHSEDIEAVYAGTAGFDVEPKSR